MPPGAGAFKQKSRWITNKRSFQKLGYPPSSIHHMLATLMPQSYVMQDPETKKYSLGLKLVDLGH